VFVQIHGIGCGLYVHPLKPVKYVLLLLGKQRRKRRDTEQQEREPYGVKRVHLQCAASWEDVGE
jgi:hypothetical protein